MDSIQLIEQESRNLYACSSPAPPPCSAWFHIGHVPAKGEHYAVISRVETGEKEDKREAEQKLEKERAGDEIKMFADKTESE